MEAVVELLTLQRGPRRIMVLVDVDFADHLDTSGLEGAVDRLRAAVQAAVPEASDIYLSARGRSPRE